MTEASYKIKPIKVKETLQFKPVPDNIPQPCFRLGLFAASGGGKTTIIVNLLMDRSFYRDYFDYVFIWSPTVSIDPTWQALRQLPKNRSDRIKVFDDFEEKDLDDILTAQKARIKEMPKGKVAPILLIFDDMIDSDIMHSKKFARLFFRGRHDHISLILSYQSYKLVQRSLRLNFSDVIVTQVQTNELSMIAGEQCNSLLSPDGFEMLFRDIKKKDKFGFIYRKCNKPAEDQYWECFDTKIDILNAELPVVKPKKARAPAKPRVPKMTLPPFASKSMVSL